MPTLDALDYDRFSYEDPTAQPLALEEAINKAKEMRAGDAEHFYRVEAVDASATGFRIQKIAVSSVYADFLSRFARRFLVKAAARKA